MNEGEIVLVEGPRVEGLPAYLPPEPSFGRVLGLVVYVDPESPSVLVAALSPYLEFATDLDVLLSPEATGLPYALVAQTDLVFPVLPTRLIDSIGFYSNAREILNYADSEGPPNPAGLPAWERNDPRREFKRAIASLFEPLQLEALKAWGDDTVVITEHNG